MFFHSLLAAAGFVGAALGCASCEHPERDITLTRNRPRMQPDAQGAVSQPRAPLEWGQLNILQTTDTHGWLEGHLKEQNYGADWGDFVSFVKHMNQTAIDAGVDLLLVDTGDLHDGAGLSDATSPNGAISNVIFENIQYDLLSIGNHELYVTDVAYETFNQFSEFYGDRYLTSNVQILDPATGQYEYIGQQYRYFETRNGLRIMSFGFLFDFTGNSNVSRVIRANQSVTEDWFRNAVNFDKPIDLFLVIGHNPPRPTASTSTFGTIYNAIRSLRSDAPIQTFGGHTHVRDFVVYDEMSTGLEAGRYCETLGWLSVSGFPVYKDISAKDLPHPTRPAVKVSASPNATTSASSTSASVVSSGTAPSSYSTESASPLLYSRRYLDWNRLTFEYHANTSAISNNNVHARHALRRHLGSPRSNTGIDRRQADSFDTPEGTAVTNTIYTDRQQLNLTALYGCAPQSWCQTCAPFLSEGNIFSLLTTAVAETVVNSSRADVPRLIYINTGSVRFDLPRGPFTYDDSFIVNPFLDTFQFIPDVPFQYTEPLLGQLNAGSIYKRSVEPRLGNADFDTAAGVFLSERETCPNPPLHVTGTGRHVKRSLGRIHRRQTGGPNDLTPGYTTSDDFGTDGDDTIHSAIPRYTQPHYFLANGSLPTDGSTPQAVDVVFLDFFASEIPTFLAQNGFAGVSAGSIEQYLPTSFTTNSYLPEYARRTPEWQAGVPNCPVL